MFARLFASARPITRSLHVRISRSWQRTSIFSRMTEADECSSRTIHTAACLIIGDEVLGGKTNSAHMAKWCFSLGISLKRIEVIEDDADAIVEAVRRMSRCFDFVVTSGGIGPTHDDITYPSIAKAFNLPIKLHEEAFARMKKLSKPGPSQSPFNYNMASPTMKARLRMVELPTDESRDLNGQVVFPLDDVWVPVSIVNGNIHILPGVPRLFTKLLDGLKPFIKSRIVDPEGTGTTRVLISTPMAESDMAAYLTELAAKVRHKGVKVGSYPRWGKSRNTVTLVGRGADAVPTDRDRAFLDSIASEVTQGVKGKRVESESDED